MSEGPVSEVAAHTVFLLLICTVSPEKKGKRKVRGVPQLQTAAIPRHKERKRKKDKTKTNRTNVRKALKLALFPKRGTRNAKRTENP